MREVALFQTTQLTVRSPEGPLMLHLDGELRMPGIDQCTVTVVPGAINVLVAR
jgi:diacylglycerol kinase family enzyme